MPAMTGIKGRVPLCGQTEAGVTPAPSIKRRCGRSRLRRGRTSSVVPQLARILIAVALNRHDRRVAHPEREPRVAALEHDTHREALREPHPVERRFDLRQPLDGRAVLLVERPSHALYA